MENKVRNESSKLVPSRTKIFTIDERSLNNVLNSELPNILIRQTRKFSHKTTQTDIKKSKSLLSKLKCCASNDEPATDKNIEVVNVKEDKFRDWKEYTRYEKINFIVFTIVKATSFILLLYLFLLSLNFMTIGFTMVSYVALRGGETIRFLLSNPFASLAIGIFITALMQNATATTSIAVSMVGAGIISDVKSSIPIIMGSNIGTCVTNSFVALTLGGDANEFKRAFSAATLNDGFNLLTTSILLPIEILFGVLDKLSFLLTKAFLPNPSSTTASDVNFIGALVNPIIDLFIKLNSTAVDAIAQGNRNLTQTALRCCGESYKISLEKNVTLIYAIQKWDSYANSLSGLVNLNNVTVDDISFDSYMLIYGHLNKNESVCVECTYWCMPMLRAFGDGGTGLFWILLSIVVLIASLFSIVKLASMLISGPIAKCVNKALNCNFPGKCKPFTEVALFLMSFVITLFVQSSNIVTATLVPLCGIGMISLNRVFVMTLGSNIGTTVTGILSAFTTPPSTLQKSLQLGFVYTLFNSFGTLFWLPIPKLRVPKMYARSLGELVFKYRWLLYVYVAGLYFIGPLIILGVALIPHWIGLAIFGIPLLLLLLFLLIVRLLRKFVPNILPDVLKDFSWLPMWLRSLEPYDKKIKLLKCCRPKKKIVIERRFSKEGDMEEFILEKDDTAEFIPMVIRRLSAIDSIVAEALIEVRRHTKSPSNSSQESDQHPNNSALSENGASHHFNKHNENERKSKLLHDIYLLK